MGRPKGSVNKTKETVAPTALYGNANIPTVIISQPIHYDVMFGIRNLRNGPFKGLWELVKLDSTGKRQVITDANSRGSIITMINKHILKIVIQS